MLDRNSKCLEWLKQIKDEQFDVISVHEEALLVPNTMTQYDEVSQRLRSLRLKDARREKRQASSREKEKTYMELEIKSDTSGRDVPVRRFRSFESFDSDINSSIQSTLILSFYKHANELRNDKKLLFRVFYSVYDNILSRLEPNYFNMNRRELITRRLLVWNMRVKLRLAENCLFNQILPSRLVKEFHESNNFTVFKEHYALDVFNKNQFDIGYHYLLPSKLKLIFDWLKDVEQHRATFIQTATADSPSLTLYTMGLIELKPIKMSNKEEMELKQQMNEE